ncbi:MAG: HD domain-containing protein [Bauldia sp.]|nr:HD domain-containing protein [Bauldia sp.]MCW5716892.1 HD domain-containing protein [Bauldia sp.]
MMLSAQFDVALVYAASLHRKQVRKGSGIPYVSHLLSVAALVIEYGGSEDQAIAGLLHDAAEDQGGATILGDIEHRFGKAVAAIVADCTDSWTEPKPAWRPRKEAYVASLAHKPAASLLVSLSDKIHNARAILADRAVVGEAIWDRFSENRGEVLWYYRALSDAFLAALPGPAANELARLVAAMEEPAP